MNNKEKNILLIILIALLCAATGKIIYTIHTQVVFTNNTDKTLLNKLKINLNTASVKTLCLLPGIGEKRAQKIIEYRKLNNGFSNIDEITKVKGIGKKRLEKMKNMIRV